MQQKGFGVFDFRRRRSINRPIGRPACPPWRQHNRQLRSVCVQKYRSSQKGPPWHELHNRSCSCRQQPSLAHKPSLRKPTLGNWGGIPVRSQALEQGVDHRQFPSERVQFREFSDWSLQGEVGERSFPHYWRAWK